jgi:hypothetical protein
MMAMRRSMSREGTMRAPDRVEPDSRCMGVPSRAAAARLKKEWRMPQDRAAARRVRSGAASRRDRAGSRAPIGRPSRSWPDPGACGPPRRRGGIGRRSPRASRKTTGPRDSRGRPGRGRLQGAGDQVGAFAVAPQEIEHGTASKGRRREPPVWCPSVPRDEYFPAPVKLSFMGAGIVTGIARRSGRVGEACAKRWQNARKGGGRVASFFAVAGKRQTVCRASGIT